MSPEKYRLLFIRILEKQGLDAAIREVARLLDVKDARLRELQRRIEEHYS